MRTVPLLWNLSNWMSNMHTHGWVIFRVPGDTAGRKSVGLG